MFDGWIEELLDLYEHPDFARNTFLTRLRHSKEDKTSLNEDKQKSELTEESMQSPPEQVE